MQLTVQILESTHNLYRRLYHSPNGLVSYYYEGNWNVFAGGKNMTYKFHPLSLVNKTIWDSSSPNQYLTTHTVIPVVMFFFVCVCSGVVYSEVQCSVVT